MRKLGLKEMESTKGGKTVHVWLSHRATTVVHTTGYMFGKAVRHNDYLIQTVLPRLQPFGYGS